jgi:hypothetical protein
VLRIHSPKSDRYMVTWIGFRYRSTHETRKWSCDLRRQGNTQTSATWTKRLALPPCECEYPPNLENIWVLIWRVVVARICDLTKTIRVAAWLDSRLIRVGWLRGPTLLTSNHDRFFKKMHGFWKQISIMYYAWILYKSIPLPPLSLAGRHCCCHLPSFSPFLPSFPPFLP